jgi:hypothetical protein
MSENEGLANGHANGRHANGPLARRRGLSPQSRNKRPRSAITSGRALFIDGDSTSAWARLWHDTIIDYAADFGGVEQCTFRQYHTIEHAASLRCELRRLIEMRSRGEPVDLKEFGYAADKHVHLLEALARMGERYQRDVTPPDLYRDVLPTLTTPTAVEASDA